MFVIPVKEKSTENVVQAYPSGIFAHEKGSIVVHSDNGTGFKNTVLDNKCEEHGTKRLFSNLFYPKAN